jgi:hypothetical protein
MALVGKSLDAVASAQEGSAIIFDVPKTAFSMQISFTGAPTSWEVHLEGSIDGTNWKNIGSLATGSPSGDILSASGKALPMIRANLISMSGGSSPTFTAWLAAA